MYRLNNSKIRYFTIGFLLCIWVLAFPVNAQAFTTQNDEQYREVLIEIIRVLQVQIEQLQTQLAAQKTVEVAATAIEDNRPKTVLNGATVLKQYDLFNTSAVENILNVKHRLYLERVLEIFPSQYGEKLREFLVFKDTAGEFGAFVKTISPTHTFWTFAVSSDLLGKEKTELSKELIVHELAHIISYESVVGLPLPATASCHTYFKKRGCPKENSYLAIFVKEFWSDSDLDRAEQFKKAKNPLVMADDYFETTAEEYISGYAALSPEEDLAESFAQYVIARESRKNTTVSKKTWWFEQFSDLQDVRDSVK